MQGFGRHLVDVLRDDGKSELAVRRMESKLVEVDSMLFSMDFKLNHTSRKRRRYPKR